MDVSGILDSLNPAQREAVTAPPGPLRVLAGAGSGKTRVLVQRIAWLIAAENASPWSIIAVTFTNKAAAEMRGRIERQLPSGTEGLWIGTFHGIAHRLLRMHYVEAGLVKDFQILDAEDQTRLLRRVIRSLNLDEKKWDARDAGRYINARKDDGKRAAHIDDRGDPVERQYVRIYQAYHSACERAGLIDFGELLLRAHETLRDNAELLQHYRSRFQHILVDEFQDTNTVQYAWLRLLSGDRGDVFIVGDDDQSIYGWRGARVENIQRFGEHFGGAQTVRLEQNYRSTGNILNAANELISNNEERLGKSLWTDDDAGQPIAVFAAFNEIEEARYVAERAQAWRTGGGALTDIAILYRSNAQSRILEETLIASRLPYRVFGGLRFFERAEVKDALAYLRLTANREDDPSFERIVNLPARGLGERTVDTIRVAARERNLSLWHTAQRLTTENALSTRAAKALQTFTALIDGLDRDTREHPLAFKVEHVIKTSGLLEHHRNAKDGRAADRVENLEELIGAAGGFQHAAAEVDIEPLPAFLSHAALEAGDAQTQGGDGIQLMTMHMAKGLEFPMVFMVGLEEGLFPNFRSTAEPGKLEEERRLAYVGITRARRELHLSFAEKRYIYGRDSYNRPSRFLKEIPATLVREVRAKTVVSRPLMHAEALDDDDGFSVGREVEHPKFGIGVIRDREGKGPRARVQVTFDQGDKWLVLAYAKLEPLG